MEKHKIYLKSLVINIGLFLLFTFFTSSLTANDPCSAISLNNNSIVFGRYDLTGQSPSGIPPPSCGDYNDPDLWFSFVAPADGEVTIEVKG